MNQRRTFIRKLTAGLGVLGLSLHSQMTKAAEVKISNALVHHVYFWLKNPDSKSDKQKLIKGLNTLLSIKEIKMSHIGIPAGTENRDVVDHSYSVSYMVIFDSMADQNIYQADLVHLRFVEEYSHLWEKVVVYDSVDP